jgi:hypothetical protein
MNDAKREYNKRNRIQQNNQVATQSADDFQSASDPNLFGYNANQGNTFITNNYYSNAGMTGYYGFSPYNSWVGFGWGNPYYGNPWQYHGGWHNPWYSSWYSPWYNPWNNPWYNPWNNPWYSPWNNPWYNPWNNPWHNPWNNPWYNPWNNPWCNNGFGNNWGWGFGGGNFGGSWAPGVSGLWGGRGSIGGTTPSTSFNPHFVAGFMKNTRDNNTSGTGFSPANNNLNGREVSKPTTTNATQNATGKPQADYSGRVRSPQDANASGREQITRPDYSRIPSSVSSKPANTDVQDANRAPVNTNAQPDNGRVITPQQQQPFQNQPQRTFTPAGQQPQQPQRVITPQQQPQRVINPQQQAPTPKQPQRSFTPSQNFNQGGDSRNPSRGSFSSPSSGGGGSFSSPSSGGGGRSSGSGGGSPSSSGGGRR